MSQSRPPLFVLALMLAALPVPVLGAPVSVHELKREAIKEVDGLAVLTQQMVDQIFSYAELGFQEYETSRYVTELLERNGFTVERSVAGIPTAWVASWGTGKPVIAYITDLDGIPRASQKPGVAYHDPIVENGPGHGEGHNSGNAVNVAAAIAVKRLMERHKIPGTLRLLPGIAEEQLATKAFYVRAGLFRDVDAVLGTHVGDAFRTSYGARFGNRRLTGLVSVQYSFKGRAAHSAFAPWQGRSALDAVELMNVGWNFRREHLPTHHRSHYVVVNGGDQPNVVPEAASVWYYFRELDHPGIKVLFELGNTMAEAASMMTGTTTSHRVVGSAWPAHFNRAIAEAQQRNIEMVGMPAWSDADQTLARALQREIGAAVEGLKIRVDELETEEPELTGGSDDIGDISWVVPTVYLQYPANIPNLPGHNWANSVAMATPIAHKGATAGAKAQATTTLDLLLSPEMVQAAWRYFREVQTASRKYEPLMGATDQPAIDLNQEKMDAFRPDLRKHYFDPGRYRTYMEQLGIQYPTVKAP